MGTILRKTSHKREAKKGVRRTKFLGRAWAAAQRFSIAKQPKNEKSGSEASPDGVWLRGLDASERRIRLRQFYMRRFSDERTL